MNGFHSGFGVFISMITSARGLLFFKHISFGYSKFTSVFTKGSLHFDTHFSAVFEIVNVP